MKKPIFIIYRTLFLVAFCIPASKLSAQYDCSVKHFTTNNGFPDNEVTALAMDYDGYLWVGTYTSLVRYDGANFKTFTFDKEKGSYNNMMMYSMVIPADKKVMIKAKSSSIYFIQDGKPILYSDRSDFANSGSWTPLYGNFPTLALYKKFYRTIFSQFIEHGYFSAFVDILPLNNKDFIAAVNKYNKVVYLKDGELRNTFTLKQNFNKFLLSKNNRLMLDELNQIYLYDSVANQFKKIDIDWKAIERTGENINDAVFLSDPFSGESFCFYNSTFYLLNFDAGKNTLKFIPQFSIDDKKHLWTGLVYDSLHSTFFLSTLTDGFFQVKLKKLHTYNINEQLAKNIDPIHVVNYSVAKTSDSTAVIPSGFQFTATTSGITFKKLGNIFGYRQTIGQLPDKSVLCTFNKIYYYLPTEGYRISHPYNNAFDLFNRVEIATVYPEGDSVWVTSGKGIFCITKKRMNVLFDWDKFKEKPGYDSLGLHNIFGSRIFYRINKEEVLIAGDSGLHRWQTVPPYKLKEIPGVKGKLVQSISAYKNVFILTAYQHGLYVLKDDRFYKVPVPEELDEINSCHTTYIDKSGYIWITTDKGLFKALASAVVDSALAKGKAPFFFYYGNADGIDNTQFTGGGLPSYAVLRGEQVLFPSLGGMVSFKPEELDDQIIPTSILIEKVTIDNKKIDDRTDSIRLHPNFKYLVIDLSVPNFGDAKNLWVEYSLDNEAWKKIALRDKLQITLVDISSGKHELVIRKRTGFGNTDFAYTKLEIFKEKAFYEQLWFYPVLLVLIVLVGWFFIWLRTRDINRKRIRLQKLVDEQTAELSNSVESKNLLINVISHDMTTPLRHISLISGILARGLEKDPEQMTASLLEIKSTSDNILSGSLAIINWMKYSNKKIAIDKKPVSLYALVNKILEMYIPIAKAKNIHFVNNVPEPIMIEADENILFTIITNLVSNAVKHSDSGEVKIFLENPDSITNFVLKVADTGPGMDEKILQVLRDVLKGNLMTVKTTSKISTGLGFLMMSELAKIHNFKISIDSELGKGTIISVYL